MPASVVIVHDDPAFLNDATIALRDAGHEVAAFGDPMVALNALERAAQVDALVTRVRFPEGKPNGISLVLVTKNKRPNLRAVFVGLVQFETFAEGIGEFLPLPVDLSKLVETVTRLIREGRLTAPQREA